MPWGRAAGHVVTRGGGGRRAHVALIAPCAAEVTTKEPRARAARHADVRQRGRRRRGARGGRAPERSASTARWRAPRRWPARSTPSSSSACDTRRSASSSGAPSRTSRRSSTTSRSGRARRRLRHRGRAGVPRGADARRGTTFETAVAKIRVGEAAGIGAGLVHQVHGAIGFTYEHSLHFATRRLWSWRAEFGSERRWAVELGRRVASRGADGLWPYLTSRKAS